MRPSLLDRKQIDEFLEAGDWSRETLVDRYEAHAADYPDRLAFRDHRDSFTWRQVKVATDHLAASLVRLGLRRDSRALVRMPSCAREILLRIAFKKVGLIGVFAPMQWGRRELDYVCRLVQPEFLVMSAARPDEQPVNTGMFRYRMDPESPPPVGWLGWDDLSAGDQKGPAVPEFADRGFEFDEVSLITASSGTSGLAKLCEWPEAAQLCVAHGIRERLGITEDDNVGMFAPMSGAAGLVVWLVSGLVPCTYTFPESYRAESLLDCVEQWQVTIGTTVPVLLARLAREPLRNRNLASLRGLRVGTAATDCSVARFFEQETGCRVIVASGSMECPGFGHAHISEPMELRLNGSVGLPLPGGRLRIEDTDGQIVRTGEVGELKAYAPYASSGYWGDPEGTSRAWREGWYATGDIASLDGTGRLTLRGRMKEIINRSGLKILPVEIEQLIADHPDVLECAVVKAPDTEYGEVPWAFTQFKPGRSLDHDSMVEMLRASGLASYKIPARFIELSEFPRVSDNKIDKKALLDLVPRPS